MRQFSTTKKINCYIFRKIALYYHQLEKIYKIIVFIYYNEFKTKLLTGHICNKT